MNGGEVFLLLFFLFFHSVSSAYSRCSFFFNETRRHLPSSNLSFFSYFVFSSFFGYLNLSKLVLDWYWFFFSFHVEFPSKVSAFVCNLGNYFCCIGNVETGSKFVLFQQSFCKFLYSQAKALVNALLQMQAEEYFTIFFHHFHFIFYVIFP